MALLAVLSLAPLFAVGIAAVSEFRDAYATK